jgi:hypothetical protein
MVKLTNLINAAIRLKHVPDSWKVPEVIVLLKPGKKHSEVDTYRPIALLPIMSKHFEKLILKGLKPILEK